MITQRVPPVSRDAHQEKWKAGPNSGVNWLTAMMSPVDTAPKSPAFTMFFFSFAFSLNKDCLIILKIYHTPNVMDPR